MDEKEVVINVQQALVVLGIVHTLSPVFYGIAKRNIRGLSPDFKHVVSFAFSIFICFGFSVNFSTSVFGISPYNEYFGRLFSALVLSFGGILLKKMKQAIPTGDEEDDPPTRPVFTKAKKRKKIATVTEEKPVEVVKLKQEVDNSQVVSKTECDKDNIYNE